MSDSRLHKDTLDLQDSEALDILRKVETPSNIQAAGNISLTVYWSMTYLT